jgi:hypothetical protein
MSDPAAALQALVAQEAHRAAAGFQPDPALLADGWEFRFVADGRRAEEMAALYREVGFDVTAVAVHGAQIAEACTACRLVTALQFQAVYTRRGGP